MRKLLHIDLHIGRRLSRQGEGRAADLRAKHPCTRRKYIARIVELLQERARKGAKREDLSGYMMLKK